MKLRRKFVTPCTHSSTARSRGRSSRPGTNRRIAPAHRIANSITPHVRPLIVQLALSQLDASENFESSLRVSVDEP